jgi:hypothetical protein
MKNIKTEILLRSPERLNTDAPLSTKSTKMKFFDKEMGSPLLKSFYGVETPLNTKTRDIKQR